MSDFEKQKLMKDYYDKSSYYGDNLQRFVNLRGPFQRYRISRVLGLYTPGKEEVILDLGCGWGTFCFAFAPLCKEVTGVDYSQKSIDLCSSLLKKNKYNNIKFICADAQKTGLESKSYDVIICVDLFEHLYPQVSERVFDECARLLKRGGKLLIWTPNRDHIIEILKNRNIIFKKDQSHVDYKSMNYLLSNLERRNFLIKKAHYIESRWPIFSIIEKMFLGVLPFLRRRIVILAEKKA